jgi:small subunit ribosomal protein S6
MPFYESVFIARQDISPAQAETLADTFTGIVKERGGDVTKREYWGLRSISYRIKKNRKGHYILLNLDAPPPAVQEMERNMRLNEDVLRFMTVRVEELEAGPSMMMQRREERGDRGDRGPRRRDYEGGDGDRGPRDGDRAPAPAPAERAPGGEA